MRKLSLFVIVFFYLNPFVASGALPTESKEKYEQARLVYAAANACLASYDDNAGNIFYKFLQYDGWQAERLSKEGELSDANLFLASKFEESTGQTKYILALRGTASRKDVRLDQMISGVLFAGNTLEEIKNNAGNKEVLSSQPRVHEGFLTYTLEAFTLDLGQGEQQTPEYFYEIIKSNPEAQLLITGHSLGGAGAVLYGATLLNLGVPASQIKVITFGAPAVGNRSFANQYKNKLDLLRVYSTYDPIPGSLQLLHSYTQFGERLVLTATEKMKRTFQHGILNYTDVAGKYYYDSKAEAIAAGAIPPEPLSYDEGLEEVVAVAIIPPENAEKLPDYKYALANLLDIYRWSFLRYRILPGQDATATLAELEGQASAVGADYLLTARLDMKRVKTGKGWIVALEQGVFKTKDSSLVSGLANSMRIKDNGSFFQTSAYNAFRAVESLFALGEGWVRPLGHQVQEGDLQP